MTPPQRKRTGGEEKTVMACDLVGDSTTVRTAMQELDVLKMPGASMSVAIPVQKKPVLKEGVP